MFEKVSQRELERGGVPLKKNFPPLLDKERGIKGVR
jgi:hypothetical protein